MALVDERGRLFGRINLLDAVIGVFALGLIPLIYGSVVLFRTPPPEILAVEPASLAAEPGQRVKIRGRNLRPYMRVSFGTVQGKDFLFKSTTEAEVNLNDLTPGVYDVVLYDFAQERSRIASAFTVLPAPIPPTRMLLVGAFGGLDPERAKALTAGVAVPGVGKIVEVAPLMPATMRVHASPMVELTVDEAMKMPAAVEVSCDVRVQQGAPYCQIGPLVLQHTMVMYGELPSGKVPFQIDQIRSLAPLSRLTVTVRFAGPKEVIAMIRRGDIDRGLFGNPLAAGATVTNARMSALSADSSQAEVTLDLQAEQSSNGWTYVGSPLRSGGSLALRTPRYELAGTILQVAPEWSAAR